MPARRINAGHRGGSCAAGGRGAGRQPGPGRRLGRLSRAAPLRLSVFAG